MRSAFLKAAGFGAGFAIMASAIITGVHFWTTRSKPAPTWNSTVLRATLADIDAWEVVGGQTTGDGPIEFTYIVHNLTDQDYSTTGTSVIAMVQRPDGLATSDGAITIEYPIFIPAGQRVAFKISIPYARALGPVEKTSDMRKVVREKLPKLAGFVLFDRHARYKINFPRP